ncbi:unnamed protein product [Mytilus coruscus]|uniref:CCHC-type domain-containing protein n=1 Tax=Mytilus coruscus TaxID=42192 RepID=A0A6J8F1T2_MYTCO|nr:unnamed protein product [Mytilus coruscus]
MQLKLMHLDEVARRVNDSNRELYSMVLQRFLCHKNHEKIGFLVTSLLSSPAETKIFEKEQKFLKVHGCNKEKVSDESPKNASNQKSENDLQQFVSMMQVAQSFFQPALPAQSPPPVKNVNYRRLAATRKIPQNYSGCFKCGDVSHFRADCPRK